MVAALAVSTTVRAADPALPDARPVPDMQVLPLPYAQASFEHVGRELTRYHFGPDLRRPFWYPIIGPEGRSLTRMGKPDDPGQSLTQAEQPKDPNKPENPLGHSHQNSVWISHKDVNGVDFWRDGGPIAGQIVHQLGREGLEYDDGPEASTMLSRNVWNDAQGKTVMFERRRSTVVPGEDGSWWLIIDVQFEAPPGGEVTLGKTPFGPIGVRMAKTIGVKDGGGRILNSSGQRSEKEAFRKPARWVDYSGPITRSQTAGITLMDHPANTRHPVPFHVRDDGWMGACLTLDEPLVIPSGKHLRLRYGLWVHPSVPDGPTIERRWQSFTKQPMASLEMKSPPKKQKPSGPAPTAKRLK
ncbi:MAG: hypothetical protein A2107_06970 [Verrucomicrobia bacterium GWF2_62_7]|nr:MAG: hypothetical protein A2107_06970 [Verrucomicrobia bacterium GWF2_62_7]